MSQGNRSAITVRGLDVRYPGAHALRGLDLSVTEGSFVLIGGRSGSGKSTLALALLGLLCEEDGLSAPRVSGDVAVAGLAPGRHTTEELSRRVGLVFQNPVTQLFNGVVEEEVAFGPRNLGLSEDEVVQRVAYALDAVRAGHLRGRSVRHLSGGEQQRIAVAATLAMRPSILILDEPTANLDHEGAVSIVRALEHLHRGLGMTVVVIEHRLRPFLGHAQRLIWLEDGSVVADGDPRGVLEEVGGELRVGKPDSRGGRPLVSLDKVTFGYNGRPVLKGCSFTLREGDFAALVGPNGSGKSTVARTLAGLERPRQGRVVWHAGRRRQGSVGLLQQNPLHQLVCATVEDEIRFAPRNMGLEEGNWLETLLEQADLRGLGGRPTQSLSVGEQQRAALAAALSIRPRLLILDEPTMGQDPYHLGELMALVTALNEQGCTVLLITHDQDLVARHAARVWELSDGCVREKNLKRPDKSVGRPLVW